MTDEIFKIHHILDKLIKNMIGEGIKYKCPFFLLAQLLLDKPSTKKVLLKF